MRLKYAILAEAAHVDPSGKFHLINGGITTIWAAKVPVSITVSVVVGLESKLAEAGDPVEVGARLIQSENEFVLAGRYTMATLPERQVPGAPLASTTVITVPAVLPDFQKYAFQILLVDNHVGSLPFVLAPIAEDGAQTREDRGSPPEHMHMA